MDEQNNTQSTPMATPATVATSPATLIGGVIVLALIIIGGWYLMQSNTTPMPEMTDSMGMMETDAATEEAKTAEVTAALSTQSNSDELDAIEADMSATDMNSLGDPNQI